MSDNIIITQEQIQKDSDLQQWGVMPGDEIAPDGTLIRNYSEIQDKKDVGSVITAEDIEVNPWMQEEDVAPGDRYVDGVGVVKDRSSSNWEQFKYHYDKAGGLLGYLKDVGSIYTGIDFYTSIGGRSAEEKYGENWDTATSEERREMLYRARERQLQEEYGVTFQPDASSVAGVAGTIVGELADPTSLIPFVGGVKGALATGGALGAAYSAAQDLSQTGEINPEKLALSTALGAALPGATTAIGKKIATSASNKVVNKVQETVNKELASPWGKVTQDNIPDLAEKAGVSESVFQSALKKTNMTEKDIYSRAVPQFAPEKAVTQDSALSRLISPALDKYLGTLSTRVKNISEPVFNKLRKFEFDVMNNTQASLVRARPFMETLKKLNGPVKQEVSRHLFNGNFNEAEVILKRIDPTSVSHFKEVRNLLKQYKKDLDDVFLKTGKNENYFPRLVKDYEGLSNYFGTKDSGIFIKAQQEVAKKKGLKNYKELSTADKEAVNNAVLRGYAPNFDGPLPRFSKARVLDTVDINLLPFYSSPEEALELYIRNATNHIERRNFFGRHKLVSEEGIDLERSVGAFVEDTLETGKLDAKQQNELRELLSARFVHGEKPLNKTFSTIKDLGYMGTIANPLSALTQLGDISTVAALKGSWNTFTSLVLPKPVKLTDVMDDQISREFADSGKFAKALDVMFKASGFKAVDRLGKETMLNAALKQNQKLSKNSKGLKKLESKWKSVFGDEYDALVDDLKTGQVSENVKFMLFNELADIQPITLSELPEKYLTGGGSRLMYMLKSFTLKQYDVVRRNIVQEYKKGNIGTASLNAFRLGSYLTAANLGVNVVKDMLQGREVDPDNIPNDAMWTLLGIYGLSKYSSERYLQRGDVTGAVQNVLMPPLPLLDYATQGIIGVATEDQEKQNKLLKLVPVIGGLLYNFFGGGLEKANERTSRERYSG